MLFEKPAKRVAREIVRERWNRIVERHPEFQEYKRELERLFKVEPYLERKLLHRAAMELVLAPGAEMNRLKKKYMLTDKEIELLQKYRELARRGRVPTAVQDVKSLLDGHESLKTLGARLQLEHKSGLTQPMHGKVNISADDETVYHELAHALVAAHIMKVNRIGPGAARLMSAMLPAHEDEAFAFAVSHHYLGMEPGEAFFQWVEERYGRMMDKWNQKAFEERYWLYRRILKEKGLKAALQLHTGA